MKILPKKNKSEAQDELKQKTMLGIIWKTDSKCMSRASNQLGFVLAGRRRGKACALTSPSAPPWSALLGEIPVGCLKSKHA